MPSTRAIACGVTPSRSASRVPRGVVSETSSSSASSQVTGALPGQDTQMHFDPADYAEGPLPVLHRPRFLAFDGDDTYWSPC